MATGPVAVLYILHVAYISSRYVADSSPRDCCDDHDYAPEFTDSEEVEVPPSVISGPDEGLKPEVRCLVGRGRSKNCVFTRIQRM